MNPILPEAAQRDLVLASRSPRRIEILQRLEFTFEMLPAADGIEQGVLIDDPYLRPVECAKKKARDAAMRRPTGLCIGADTVVILDDTLLEKPRDDDEVRRFLRMLSDRTHSVVTGLAVCRSSDDVAFEGSEQTEVRFRSIDDDEIARYVASGEGRDKAGAYAVQGHAAAFVQSIHGCFYNVVGLPVALLFDLLKKASV